MTRVQRAISFTVLTLTIGAASAVAQTPYTVETRPYRGFMPSADQLTSPVDSVEPLSGKLHIEVPLASLPRGRANSGFDLSLVYDSHLYDLEAEALDYYATPEQYRWMLPITGYNLVQGTTGGWHYSIDNLKFDGEVNVDAPDEYPCPSAASGMKYRLRVGLLDGSLHTMILKAAVPPNHNDLLQQGWTGTAPFVGTANYCAQSLGYPYAYTGWLTYYSIDGSYLKLEMYVSSTDDVRTHPFYLYFPDGRRISGHGWTFENIYDANGNAVHISYGCNDQVCNQFYTAITDNAGHEIRINHNIENVAMGVMSAFSDAITCAGPNGGTMTTTVNWAPLELGADNSRTYGFSTAPFAQTKPFHRVFRNVKYVQLPLAPAVDPSQPPPAWNSFAFGYAGDPGGWGEINSMRTPSGMLVDYSWGGIPATGSTNAGTYVAQRKITHDGISNDLVWTYFYGWDGTRIVNPDQSQTVYWREGDLVKRIDRPNGSVEKRVWSFNPPGLQSDPGAANPWISRETTTVGNAAGVPSATAVTDRMIDKNGNLLQTTEYDWVPYNPSGPETGNVARRVTQFVYYADVPSAPIFDSLNSFGYWNPSFFPPSSDSARRLNAIRRKQVSDGAGAITAVTEFAYDDPFRAGNVTSELYWDTVKSDSAPGLGALSSSNSQVLTRSYDGYGNVTDFYEPQIRTHITYDASGSFPTRVDYAYQTAQQRSWGYNWNVSAGFLNSKTDLDNNVTTSYTYDAAGRPKITTEAGLRQTETIYDDPNLMVTVKKDLNTIGDGKLQISTQYDQLGRSVLSRSSEPGNPDGIKVKSTYYPLLNRTVHSSPYRTLSDATLEWTCTQSDSSKRVIAVAIFKGAEPADCASTTNRTGVTSTVYDSNQTMITDAASKQNTQIVDSLGRLINVVEDPNGLSYITAYAYDLLGNLIQVNQGTQTRSFSYSSLGRLLSATNPESGTINYAYFDSGDLQSRSDARGVVASMTYDNMHRVKTKSYTGDGGGTPNVTYSYYDVGSSAPNIGQLQSMSSSAATVNYGGYDVLGRMGTNTQTTNGNAYTFHYTYRLNDSISSMQYPSGKTVNYAIDDAGRVNQITAGTKTYADLTTTLITPFTADGRIAQMKLGNDLWETRIFQVPGSPTLLKLGTSAGANDRLELEYDYSETANNGNLVSQIIRQPGHTWHQEFTYDSLNRLATAAETGGFSQTYGYDRHGNRWVSGSSGITAYEPHEPTAGGLFNTANNRMANQSYDAAGNQTSYDPRTMAYDAEDRMISASSPQNGSESYLYDGDGRRVRKTWTPYGGTTQVTTYVYGPGGQIAAEYANQISSSTGTSWMFTDLLGSVRAVTAEKSQSGTATMTECYDYLPFGRILSSNDNGRSTGCYPNSPDFSLSSVESPKFTGKILDTETGLTYFGARYMSAAEGRFITPDWSFTPQPVPYADSANPQSLNLYSYMRNNPLAGRDSDGHCCDWNDVSEFGSGFADTTYRPIVQAASHPIDTGTGIIKAVAHPVSTATAIKNAVLTTTSAALSGDPNAIGKVTGTVASALLTAGAAKAASGLVEGAEIGGIATESTLPSVYRFTAEGESFIRYETESAAFSRVTVDGGLQPGTFAAPSSEGLLPQSMLKEHYNLPAPEIPRVNAFRVTPPGGTLIVGPRPVAGGIGNEVIFPNGVMRGSVGSVIRVPNVK